MNEKKLLKYAVDYLSKYDSSKKNLIDVLNRKIFRLKLTKLERDDLLTSLKNIIEILEKNNLINDKRYSLNKITSLANSGKSKKYILSYLIKKGVNKLEIISNIEEFNDNDWELNSAKIFAKKKRLLEKNENYEKKLSKMARAGFSYDICKKVLG